MTNQNKRTERSEIDIDFISAIENNVRALEAQIYCLETSDLLENCSPDMISAYLGVMDGEAVSLRQAFETIKEDLIRLVPVKDPEDMPTGKKVIKSAFSGFPFKDPKPSQEDDELRKRFEEVDRQREEEAKKKTDLPGGIAVKDSAWFDEQVVRRERERKAAQR